VAGFTVLAELGRGAASIIYLVQDPKTKQIWALKHVAKEDKKDQRFLEQTMREYEVGSKVDHPRIRKVERAVKSRQMLQVKELFLLMEYVDGVSLEIQQPETLEDAVSVFKQAAGGLAHMHDCGWVHADIKPNNICVLDDGEVKIIDLGQSCPVGTVKPRIQGTPDYIAPEQVHRREITPKTDIYNLGATMYWTLTGKHIPTALPKDDSLVSSLEDQFIEKPTPIEELRPGLPQRLIDLVMECVKVAPDDRPPDMRNVADRLDLIHAQLLSGDQVASAAVGDDDEDEED